MAEMAVAVWMAVLVWMGALCVIDIRHRRLPNWLTLSGAGVIVAAAAVVGHGTAALAGAALLGGIYLLVHLLAPGQLGAGDVKLALGLGALCGVAGSPAWLLAALGAAVLTALASALWRQRVLPHGPALCAATLGAVLLV